MSRYLLIVFLIFGQWLSFQIAIPWVLTLILLPCTDCKSWSNSRSVDTRWAAFTITRWLISSSYTCVPQDDVSERRMHQERKQRNVFGFFFFSFSACLINRSYNTYWLRFFRSSDQFLCLHSFRVSSIWENAVAEKDIIACTHECLLSFTRSLSHIYYIYLCTYTYMYVCTCIYNYMSVYTYTSWSYVSAPSYTSQRHTVTPTLTENCVLNIHEYSKCLVSFWYCSRSTVTVDTVGCNNGIGGFNENLVTFWGTKLPGFQWA